jgi:predicted MPP superfamily phosphohydrolase
MATTPPGAYTILLYHTPDLAEAAAAAGVDLYLAGHTHGGQIRLPWYGALTTSSAYGKRFEAGLYQVDLMSLYVSRGIGLEGLRLPRARFLCPPEIIVIDMIGPESSKAGSPSLSEAP